MALNGIAFSDRYVVAALDHARAATLTEEAFNRDGYVEVRVGLMRMQRGKQACATAADDQNVSIVPLDIHDV